MKIEAAKEIASLVKGNRLNEEYIIPSMFKADVADGVVDAIIETARKLGLNMV